MSNQVEPGTFGGAAREQDELSPQEREFSPQEREHLAHDPEQWQPARAFHGRPVSWIAVGIIMAGFLIGGLALVFGPTWWLFWVAVGLVAVGGLLSLATNIFEDWY